MSSLSMSKQDVERMPIHEAFIDLAYNTDLTTLTNYKQK